MLIIPLEQLALDTLEAVLEEFITREGTDYGEREYSLAEKKQQLLSQLRSGQAVLCFDEQSHSCSILPKESALAYADQAH